jgi:hypothetical protein
MACLPISVRTNLLSYYWYSVCSTFITQAYRGPQLFLFAFATLCFDDGGGAWT